MINVPFHRMFKTCAKLDGSTAPHRCQDSGAQWVAIKCLVGDSEELLQVGGGTDA